MKKKPRLEDFKLGSVFFSSFRNDTRGVFGYIKYDYKTRSNPKSFDMPLADIYNRVCRLDEWSEDIKQEKIKIHDMILSAGYFYKTQHNPAPMVLTDYRTKIIHPVRRGFFKIGSKKYWYDADVKNIILPENEEQYRQVEMIFPPYDKDYIEAIFNGKDIKYGDPIHEF